MFTPTSAAPAPATSLRTDGLATDGIGIEVAGGNCPEGETLAWSVRWKCLCRAQSNAFLSISSQPLPAHDFHLNSLALVQRWGYNRNKMKVRLPPRRPGCGPGPRANLAAQAAPWAQTIVLLWPEEPGKGSEKVALELAFPTGEGDDGVRVRRSGGVRHRQEATHEMVSPNAPNTSSKSDDV